ncbi:LacI family DNA-binding transcriptional regulator [Algirhabdus cladophorae]|uniref:LacI family DNA-binding transcriptional regulator n=1 Tax=Algirhabdus cladophorae TaxID=3377108 RepID=UPI003B84AC28
MNRKVTSLDVAARAGVSQSAVSRVFSGASASQRTVDAVREAADHLGYRPNVVARSLITGRSKIIGLVVAYLDNAFYPDALERFSNELQAQGYHILIFMAHGTTSDIDRVVADLLDHQVDGIIAASVGLSDALTDRCRGLNIPVVLFNRGDADPSLPQVTSANFAGGQKVAKYLVQAGYQRIAHISGWSGSKTGQDRAEGFADGLVKAGSQLIAQVDGMYKREVAAAAAQDLVQTYAVDAIFVGNDHMAFAVLDHLRFEMGLSVPDDVAIVGYDDVPMAAWSAFDLTTVRQPSGRMVQATVYMLLALIEGEENLAPKHEIDGELIIRGSTRALEQEA